MNLVVEGQYNVKDNLSMGERDRFLKHCKDNLEYPNSINPDLEGKYEVYCEYVTENKDIILMRLSLTDITYFKHYEHKYRVDDEIAFSISKDNIMYETYSVEFPKFYRRSLNIIIS